MMPSGTPKCTRLPKAARLLFQNPFQKCCKHSSAPSCVPCQGKYILVKLLDTHGRQESRVPPSEIEALRLHPAVRSPSSPNEDDLLQDHVEVGILAFVGHTGRRASEQVGDCVGLGVWCSCKFGLGFRVDRSYAA